MAGATTKLNLYLHLVLIDLNLNLNNHLCASRDVLMDSADLATGMQ